MTRKPPTALKLRAYKKHWKTVWGINDELSKQYIHDNLRLGEVATESQLAYSTVIRFFRRGKYGKAQGYSLFAGPAITTIVGIADAIGMELQLALKPPGERRLRRTSNGQLQPASTSTTSTGSRPPSKKRSAGER